MIFTGNPEMIEIDLIVSYWILVIVKRQPLNSATDTGFSAIRILVIAK